MTIVKLEVTYVDVRDPKFKASENLVTFYAAP